jgi:NAD(P)-dependent dehydrogenase (short-subunit alcohol dehydrogenase family)
MVVQRLREEDLHGEVALVTGGSRGLGFLLARELGRAGCRVAICARDEAELVRAKEFLEREAIEVLSVRCDVSRQEDVVHMVEQVRQRFGGIDILVNNAGIIQVGPIHTMTLDDFREAMDIMFWGVLYPTMEVLPEMRRRRSGRIVNITSIGALISVPHLAPYSAAKFAAEGFSEALHAELAGDGITVTTVAPGLMRTGSPLHAQFKGEQAKQYQMFTLLDSLPMMSIDAERVARRVVEAVRRRESQLILSPPANIGARAHGVMPGITAKVLGLVSRTLPKGGDPSTGKREGKDLQPEVRSDWFDAATAWTQDAADRFLQR